MKRNRKILIAVGILGFVILVAVCVPFFISDRETANMKAMMRNLAEPSTQTATNATTATVSSATNGASQNSSDIGKGGP